MATRPRETAWRPPLSRNPVIVIAAGRSTECFLIAAQVAVSGTHVRAAACSGVSLGNSFVSEIERRSISPIRSLSPLHCASIPADPPANATSIRHSLASWEASRHRNVGAAKSGGKIDPSAG
jgi:hypothetical protein